MPESPEVQVLVEALERDVRGRTVVDSDVSEFRVVKTRGRALEDLHGETVQSVNRYGKHVDIAFEHSHLVVSLGRAGWIFWGEQTPSARDTDQPLPAVARLALDNDQSLQFVDMADWLSLGLSIVDSPSDVSAIAKLGPDPLDPGFTREQFDGMLGRRKQIKSLLQEQETLAGVGNAYSDEILHTARISPTSHASALSSDQRDALFDALTTVMRSAVQSRRDVAVADQKAAKKEAMRVHGRTGETCVVCGDTIADIPGSKGSAQYCPTCQPSDSSTL